MHIADDAELSAGDYVQIVVTDTGMGMDETTLQRAMEPFFTTKPVGKGTGLGLAQIYGSARQAGGTVKLASQPRRRPTVRVLFPYTDREPQLNAGATPLEIAASKGERVLLVDDDQDLRQVMRSALEAQGYCVTEAPNGELALAELETEMADVAVLDFAMPGMNGAELAKRIAVRWPTLPILFASGFADTTAIESAAGTKVTLLQKPFRIDELLHAISDLLRTFPR